MGKKSQRKKELRTQRKQRESSRIQVNPAFTPAIIRQDQPKPLTLCTIPLEIRFKIFSYIAHGSHTITIGPNFHIYSPLTGLIDSHPQLEKEIAEWRKCYARPAIHPVFGEFNPGVTTFQITFRSNEQRVTHVYGPEESQSKILTLELWKRAMDMVGTNKQLEVNRAIGYLTRRLWKWRPEMGPKKGTTEFRAMQEQLRFLLFDESHGDRPVIQGNRGRRVYMEPLGDKPVPDPKPDLVYQKVYEKGNDLLLYYRSLGLDMQFGDAVRDMEHVRCTWNVRERSGAEKASSSEKRMKDSLHECLAGTVPSSDMEAFERRMIVRMLLNFRWFLT